MAQSELELVREIETLALHAWPARLQENLDGWVLRENAGVTGRANSVWPNADSKQLPLAEKIALAEAFYRECGLTPKFQISPAARPPELEGLLEARRYSASKPTLVQVAEAGVLVPPAGGQAVTIHEDSLDGWFEAYLDIAGYSEREAAARREILCAIGTHTVDRWRALHGWKSRVGLPRWGWGCWRVVGWGCSAWRRTGRRGGAGMREPFCARWRNGAGTGGRRGCFCRWRRRTRARGRCMRCWGFGRSIRTSIGRWERSAARSLAEELE